MVCEIVREKVSYAKLLMIAGSAGSINPIKQLLSTLPENYALPVVVLIHLGEGDEFLMVEGFSQHCHLPVKEALDKQELAKGTVYVSPGGYHLLIEQDAHFALSEDQREYYCRPSIDVLFLSAISCYKDQCAAVLFSGSNKDGANGVYQICKAGGQAWVQDPEEAEYSEMPSAAINCGASCYVLNTKQIIQDVNRLVLPE